MSDEARSDSHRRVVLKTPEQLAAEQAQTRREAHLLGLTLTGAKALDRVRQAIQDGKTSTGEVLTVARLEDLSEQVGQQATPTAVQFQVRFVATPAQGHIPVFVVPTTLVAFVDGNPAGVTPTVDVDSNGLFTLPSAPVETLQVSYAWNYFQNGSLEAFVDEARAWLQGPATFATLEEVPDGLTPALIDNAASRALRALGAKLRLASAHAGDSGVDFSDLMKQSAEDAEKRSANATAVRQSYYSRADRQLAPAGAVSGLAIPQYQPRH